MCQMEDQKDTMMKKMCKHNNMTEVLPYMLIGGTRKHVNPPSRLDNTRVYCIEVVSDVPSKFVIGPRHFVCPNYGTPNVSLNWWKVEVHLYQQHTRDSVATVVTDLGGHGRSGLYCAILMAHVLGISGQEAIARLRQMHCEQAVETPEQEAYVVRIANELRNWKG